MRKGILACLLIACMSAACSGCRQEEDMGDKLEEGLEEVGDALDDAADEIEDRID